MRSAVVTACVTLLSVGACTSGEANNHVALIAAEPGAPIQEQVVQLSAPQRHAVLLRAIHDGGAPCQGVNRDERGRDRGNDPLFVTYCNDGPSYAVTIADDGVAEVTRIDR
jgi:hypothetical protein